MPKVMSVDTAKALIVNLTRPVCRHSRAHGGHVMACPDFPVRFAEVLSLWLAAEDDSERREQALKRGGQDERNER